MRSLISIDFPAPEMEPESAHVVSQLSPFPSSNAAIAMQHHRGNIHQSVASPRYSATPWTKTKKHREQRQNHQKDRSNQQNKKGTKPKEPDRESPK